MDAGVAGVRLVRGDKMNALDPVRFEALVETGRSLIAMPGLRAVVLSGEGHAFCVGRGVLAQFALCAGHGRAVAVEEHRA